MRRGSGPKGLVMAAAMGVLAIGVSWHWGCSSEDTTPTRPPDTTPPATVPLYVEEALPDTVGLQWQAPGDNGTGGGRAAAYDLRYPYTVDPAVIGDTSFYPLGGSEMGELLLAACLSVAEQRYKDDSTFLTEGFKQRLAAAVNRDAQAHSPDSLGFSETCDGQLPEVYHHPAMLRTYNGAHS